MLLIRMIRKEENALKIGTQPFDSEAWALSRYRIMHISCADNKSQHEATVLPNDHQIRGAGGFSSKQLAKKVRLWWQP